MEKSKFVISAAAFNEKYKDFSSKLKLVACDMPAEDKMSEMASYVQDLNLAMNSLVSDMNYLFGFMDHYTSSHAKGHLPPVQGAGNMKKALKALGMEQDYSVQSPVIYANEGSHKVAILDVVPKK